MSHRTAERKRDGFDLRPAVFSTSALACVIVLTHLLCRYLSRNLHDGIAGAIASFVTLAVFLYAFHPKWILRLLSVDVGILVVGLADIRDSAFNGSVTGWYIKTVSLLLTLQFVTLMRAIIITPYFTPDDELSAAMAAGSFAYLYIQWERGMLQETLVRYCATWASVVIVYSMIIGGGPDIGPLNELQKFLDERKISVWRQRNA